MTAIEGRTAAYPIDALFLGRWSPQRFTGEPIGKSDLMTILEAARWAPSSSNVQPWRYLYAHRDTTEWPKFFGVLSESNRAWAVNAAVLMFALSRRTVTRGDKEVPSYSHSFDAGAAWQNLSLQANMLGWHTHGMLGLDRDAAVARLGVPDSYRLECAIAIGRRRNAADTTEGAQAAEVPNGRNPVESFAFEGNFPES